MEKRVIFINDHTRRSFFNKVYKLYNLNSWRELYLHLSIAKSVFEKYRAGSLTIPYTIYSRLISKFKQGDKKEFLDYIKMLDSNWGSVLGGKSTYSKHKEIFDKGRKKGIEAIKKRSISFNINMPLNEDLTYFIGLFVGDGFTNKYGNHYMFQFVGHKQELGFYKDKVIPLAKRLFNIFPNIKEDAVGNFIRVDYYSSCLFRLTTERFKINRGRKSRTVLIPKEILDSDRRFLLSFIAGIYDAEACVFLDRRPNYLKPYPRIDLHMVNPALIEQINNILLKEGIKTSISGDYERILIYGWKNINGFLEKVKLFNPKHLKKIESCL